LLLTANIENMIGLDAKINIFIARWNDASLNPIVTTNLKRYQNQQRATLEPSS